MEAAILEPASAAWTRVRSAGPEPKIGAAYLIHPLRIATADNFLEYNLKKFLLPRAVRWPNLQRWLHMVSVFALEATHPARSRPFLPSGVRLSASHPTRPRTFGHRPAMTHDRLLGVFVASKDIHALSSLVY